MLSHSSLPEWFLFPVRIWYVWLIIAIAARTTLLVLHTAAENYQSRLGQRLVQTAILRPRLARYTRTGLQVIMRIAVSLLVLAFGVIGANAVASIIGSGLGETWKEALPTTVSFLAKYALGLAIATAFSWILAYATWAVHDTWPEYQTADDLRKALKFIAIVTTVLLVISVLGQLSAFVGGGMGGTMSGFRAD